MGKPKDPGRVAPGLVFAADNYHSECCGTPPKVRTKANAGLYYGYFENRFGEQFVFTFDRRTKTGVVTGGDLEWDNPKSFTLELVEAVTKDSQRIATHIVQQTGTIPPGLPIVDAAFALGRITGVTGKDEVMWLRACLAGCAAFEAPLGDHYLGSGGSPTSP